MPNDTNYFNLSISVKVNLVVSITPIKIFHLPQAFSV